MDKFESDDWVDWMIVKADSNFQMLRLHFGSTTFLCF